MKKGISTLLLIFWICFKVGAQEQLSSAGAEGFSSSTHLYMTNINNKCLFKETFSNGFENALMVTDGTTEGTALLGKNLIVAPNKKQFFVEEGRMFYLVRNDDNKLVEIWRTDGTSANTVKVNEVADSSFFANEDYFLQKSDRYYYLVGYASATKKAFIGQFDKEFRLLTQESSAGKYEGYPLIFKDLLFLGKLLYRTKDNTNYKDLNTFFYPDSEQFTVAGDKLYFMAYRQNMLFEFDGVNTRQVVLPVDYTYGSFAKRIFIDNNRLYLVYVNSSGTMPNGMVTIVKEYVYNTDNDNFEQAFLVTPWGYVIQAQLFDHFSYLVTFYAGTDARGLSIHKIAYDSTHQTTVKKFGENQLYPIILNNGKNLFILKKDYFDSEHLLYDADKERILSLASDVVFNEFIGQISPGLWLLHGRKGNTQQGFYTLNENTGQVLFLKENNTTAQGIQKLYKLNDKTLIWSVPENGGIVVYKSDGTKNGTVALQTIPSDSWFPSSAEYDNSELSDGTLLVNNLRQIQFYNNCLYCDYPLKPLVYATDGTPEGTKKIYESEKPLFTYMNSKVGDTIFHAEIRSDNLNRLRLSKNSLTNTNLTVTDSMLSVISTSSMDFLGASIIYSWAVGGIAYKYLGGEIIVEPGINPEYIGRFNKKVLFQANSGNQTSIYTLQGNEMVRLFTIEANLTGNAQYSFSYDLDRIAFAGYDDYLYITDGTRANTIKIPLLVKGYQLTRFKEFDDTYYFLFSRTINNINEYKVQTYENGTTAESGISPAIFEMNQIRIADTTYLYQYGFSNGVGIDIYRLENGMLNKETFVGSDYEYFPVRKLSDALLANPYGKVYLWTPKGTYEVAQGTLGEAVQLGDKYIFAIRSTTKQQVYVTDRKGGKAQLLKEFQSPNIYFKVFGNKVYFNGATPDTGVEPWVTDGTPEGTRMIGDLWKGPQSSNPDIFFMTSVNDIPVCVASTPDSGRQLFSLLQKLDAPVLVVPNTRACEGDTIMLTASKGYDTYKWIIDDGKEISTTENKLSVTKSGTYKVIVSKDKASSYPSNAVSIDFIPLPAKPVVKQESNQLSVTVTGQLQWYLNGSPIAGATTNTLTYTGAGDYMVKVTENGCSVLSDKLLVSITATEEIWADAVYPNPTSNKLMVKVNQSQPVELKLIDIQGVVVLERTLTEPVNELSLKYLTKGVYILKLNHHRKKIIIE